MHSTGASGPKQLGKSLAGSPGNLLSGRNLQVILGPGLNILDANPTAIKALGLPIEQLIGTEFPGWVAHPEAARALHASAVENGRTKGHLLELRSGKRAGIHLLCQAAILPGSDLKVLVKARDITSRRHVIPSSAKDQERFRIAFEYAKVGVGMVDLDGNIFEANQPFADTFGFTREELKSMNLLDIWVPEERTEALADFHRTAKGGKTEAVFERRYLNKAGEILFAEVTRGLALSESGKPLYLIVSFRDITESKRLQRLLEERASTDPLTGAMNRHGIEERANFELLRSDRYGDRLSVVMIDLDRFKAVNDTHGHLVGDRVLRGFSDIARSCLRSTDMLGRWGGEEFVALLPETGLAGAHLFCERLRATLEDFRFDGGIQVRASMGIAGHREGEGLTSLVGRADASLYTAKQSGRNRTVIDTEDMESERSIDHRDPKLTPLHWKASSRTGDPAIDDEHEESFRLTNLIIEAMAGKGAETGILPLVYELVEHVSTHFRHEEDLLQAVAYPEAAGHGEIHRQLIDGARELARHFERGEGSAADLLGFLIYDLVARHLLVEDRKFFPWLKESHS